MTILCFLPTYAFILGISKAYSINEGIKYQYIYSKSLDKKLTPANVVERLKYLGYANNYIFLLSMDNKTILIKNIDKIDDFELHTYKKSDEKKTEEKPKEQPK